MISFLIKKINKVEEETVKNNTEYEQTESDLKKIGLKNRNHQKRELSLDGNDIILNAFNNLVWNYRWS